MSLRELKKLKTRKIIADTALRLFMERGFEAVGVAEIAEKSEVSVTTLFKYFPSKESVLFDLEDELEAKLVAAITTRERSKSILDAVHEYFLQSPEFHAHQQKEFKAFLMLIKSSPALVEYSSKMWMRFHEVLSEAIRADTKCSEFEADAMAGLMLEGANRAKNSPHPVKALEMVFGLLKTGWKK